MILAYNSRHNCLITQDLLIATSLSVWFAGRRMELEYLQYWYIKLKKHYMLFTIQKPEAQSELLQSASLQQQRNIQKG